MKRVSRATSLILAAMLLPSCVHQKVATYDLTPQGVPSFNTASAGRPHDVRLTGGKELYFKDGVGIKRDGQNLWVLMTAPSGTDTAALIRASEIESVLRYGVPERSAGLGAKDGAKAGLFIGAGGGLLFGALIATVASKLGEGEPEDSKDVAKFLLFTTGIGGLAGAGAGALVGGSVGSEIQPVESFKLQGF